MASAGKGAKNKGANFERKIAKLFTQWFKNNNLEGEFYKTPASGGLRWQKRDDVIGDLCTPDNFLATIECKNTEVWQFRELFQQTLAVAPKKIQKGKNKGKPVSPSSIGEFWYQSCDEAQRADRLPMLVFTKNYYSDYIMVSSESTVLTVYHSEFIEGGIVKRFNTPIHLPFMKNAYVLQLKDFMNIVDPKLLIRS
jgi:hypothetical protein